MAAVPSRLARPVVRTRRTPIWWPHGRHGVKRHPTTAPMALRTHAISPPARVRHHPNPSIPADPALWARDRIAERRTRVGVVRAIVRLVDAGGWWNQLSVSSQGVLRWAHAFALTRSATASGASSTGPSTAVEADVVDVLAGLLLQHGGESEPWDFFAHFGLPVGVLLGGRRVELDALLGAHDASEKEHEVPPVDADVRALVDYGVATLATHDPEGRLSFTLLFAALLETPSSASTAIRRALDAKGASSSEVVASYREYATDRSVQAS